MWISCERWFARNWSENAVRRPPKPRLGMGKSKAIRCAVGQADGVCGAIWRIWVTRSDAYVSVRVLGGSYKVSLHESGLGKASMTREALAKPERWAKLDRPMPRVTWRFPRPVEAQVPCAFFLLQPSREVDRPAPADSGDVAWIPAPPIGASIEFQLWIVPRNIRLGPDDWPAKAAMATGAIGSLGLANGATLWVTWRELPDDADLMASVEPQRRAWRAVARTEEAPGDGEIRALVIGERNGGEWGLIDFSLREPLNRDDGSDLSGIGCVGRCVKASLFPGAACSAK